MELKALIFYIFALSAIGSAVVVVTIRNIVHAAFSLMVTLFSVAGLYVFLQADFLAATQVIVYVGGILVLILFGVMMTSGRLEMRLQLERGQLFWGGIVSLLILLLLLGVIINTPQWKGLADDGAPSLGPTTKQIGNIILKGEFLLPFEVASILLLVALIGAALISRKEVRDEE
jgi:NADH-quinone oxidoreductase subunit J